MSAADQTDAELLEICGSPEAVEEFTRWSRSQVAISQALWDEKLPDADRRRAIAKRLRDIAHRLSDEDGPVFLNGLANLIDPETNGETECLAFAHRRAGNPKASDSAMTAIERMMIVTECQRRYQAELAGGHSRHGLKKKISDEVGKLFGQNGSTIDKLWRVPKQGERHVSAKLFRHRPKR
jgi:hypothetical protein